MYHRTLFNTPLITPIFRWLGWLMLRLGGWEIKGRPPAADKYLVIAYPHTSNWDVPYTLAICLQFGLQIHWMGKSSLFRGPMGPLMRWLGGIPVYIGQTRNTVQQMVEAFDSQDQLILVIAPEANRAYVERWKSGFYHIASGAGVPIVLGYLDFDRREGGYLRVLAPCGNLERDLATIKTEYRGIKGKYPAQSVY